jgi:hypothetical protein
MWFSNSKALAALLGLAALFLLGLFSTELADSDAWWHLKTGQYIVTQHRLPYPDPFAYTTALVKPAYTGEAVTQRFNLTHEWLAQALMYLIESAGGLGAVVLWKALLLTLCCGLTAWIAQRRAGSWWWGIAAALAAAPVLTGFAHDRPSLLSYAFPFAFIAVLETRRRLWLLPILALIWANCHGGFFLGWVVCGAYCAEALLTRAPDARRILAFSGAAVLASGLNPNGFNVVSTLVSYRQSPLTATLIEWSRPGFWGEPYAFFLLLYGAAAALAFSWKRVRIADWLMFAAFAAASLAAFRNLPLMALLAPILIATYFPWKLTLPAMWKRTLPAMEKRTLPAMEKRALTATGQRTLPAIWKRRLPAMEPYAAYAAAAALACGLVWGIASGAFFQLRAAEWRYPAGAADFLRQHGIRTRLFNTYEDGGYFIWRGTPVFIDGRSLSENVFQDYRMIMGTPPGDQRRDQTLSGYRIGAIAINAFEYTSGVLYPLALALSQPGESEWKLVYDDPAAMVFLHDPPPGVPVLDKARIFDHLESECALHVSRDPAFPLCARTLGEFFLQAGDPVRARRNLALYLAHPDGDDPQARQQYLQLLQRQ